MARSDVGTNDVVALQRDLAARATGGWRVLRGIYTDDVRAIVEAAGSLSLGDLQRVELAEYLSMVELLRSAEDPGDRLIERLETLLRSDAATAEPARWQSARDSKQRHQAEPRRLTDGVTLPDAPGSTNGA